LEREIDPKASQTDLGVPQYRQDQPVMGEVFGVSKSAAFTLVFIILVLPSIVPA
jgi:hypothetical protein